MLVMRPTQDLLTLRGTGRVVAVFVGALAASLLLLVDPSYGVIAIVLWLVLVMMAATSQSRWYVTPAFTSFLILWSLLYGKSELDDVKTEFHERVTDTLIGVAVAYLVGVGFPALLARRKARGVLAPE
jgi:uncharacterized membrane protein YccC